MEKLKESVKVEPRARDLVVSMVEKMAERTAFWKVAWSVEKLAFL